MALKHLRNGVAVGQSTHKPPYAQRHTLLITMDRNSYDNGILEDPEDSREEFRKLSSQRAPEPDALNRYFTNKLYQAVYGSNKIDNVGGDLDVTIKLCRSVFEGKTTDSDDLWSLSAQGYRDIVQHVKAGLYIFGEITNGDLSEAMILETHRILVNGIDIKERTLAAEYSGRYRQCPAQTLFRQLMHEKQVPSAMKQMIASYKADVLAAAKKGEIDPVALAAKYCHIFVNIHPFVDGNGRMSRLILNAILFKFAGCLIAFGQDESDKALYLGVALSGSLWVTANKVKELGDLPKEPMSKNHGKLASFTLKHALESMQEICDLK
ncbi:Adenosine monophosphate-protein transferase FICD like protein [Fusarium austroafricanum]|uniref:Adenosine monophosphate-protein transferase FICD like protein n=1 Tax=Fusarium austroafricanum TaxID=2364996 RepID=A0A8H4KJV4_9HYPO|nr:Adenosine monophosphate-protein transferase FICD like protein [Fusarium austroafricanum]